MNTLEACLHELAPCLRAPLVTPEGLARVSALGKAVPAKLVAYYLECRLSPPTSSIDLLAGATRSAGRPSARSPAPPAPAHPLEDFVGRWLSGSVASGAGLLWLEMDDGTEPTAGPFSNVHVCVDRGYVRAGPSGGRGTALPPFERESARLLLMELADAALLSPRELDPLMRCLAELPREGRLVHVSSMTGRAPVETKAYLAIPRSALGDYVAEVGGGEWTERLEALDPWADAELNGSTVYCDLTFRGSSCQSVGLVFSQPQIAEVRDDPSRAMIRRRLMQEGLSTLAQDAALSAWMQPPTDAVCGFDPTRRLSRWLDIKVTLTLARLTSKAYLGFAPRVSLF